MAAGVPQLIMALAHDQYDNAARIQKLGIGNWTTPTWFRGPRVARMLDRLLTSAQVATACHGIAERLKRRDGLPRMAEALETWSLRQLATPVTLAGS
jgi:rhamnosyltransferase subunit B